MILDGGTRRKRRITGCYTRIVRIIGSGQFRDPALVPSEVVAQFPSEVLGLNGHGIDIELHPLIFHTAYIRRNDVGKVRSGRSTDTIQQVLGPLVIILQRTCNPIVQETEIHSQVIGRGFFPFQIGTIPVRFQQVRIQVLSGRIGTQGIGRQVQVIADFLLTGHPIPEAKFQLGKDIAPCFHPRLIQESPGESHRRESTPTIIGSESGRTVPT